jgi:hypothetical protein
VPSLFGIDLPARLVFRAFDDLHALAQAARALPDIEARLALQLDRLEARAGEVLEAMEQAEARLAEGILVGRALDERADTILENTERVITAAYAVAEGGENVAAALPSLEASAAAATVLAQTAEPLQGLVERLGRVVDRLPGASRRTSD